MKLAFLILALASAASAQDVTSTLQQSALEAGQQWTYKPYLVGGTAREVDTTITINDAFGTR